MNTITDRMKEAGLEAFNKSRAIPAGPSMMDTFADVYAAMEAARSVGPMPRIGALVDRFLAWKLPATVRPDGWFGDPVHHQYLSGTNLLSAEEARLMFEHVLTGITPLDVTLTKDEAEYIAAFITEEAGPGDDAVRLMVGDGHAGYGLYAAEPEYLDEGAILVKALPDAAQSGAGTRGEQT